ncbi:hypothetical protein BSU04_24745 [Caballeronia sordidicola]|uniref:Uncharacterized protein n=1 Tax=Caballeronia sordidicola TaxID=196367 RepID=A0A226WYI3_CABSO|nr:hypothetical protein BSU04_24745 [Caballeronia sordidicola]
MHCDGGPWHVDDCELALAAALAAPAAANKATAAKRESMRFMRHLGELATIELDRRIENID